MPDINVWVLLTLLFCGQVMAVRQNVDNNEKVEGPWTEWPDEASEGDIIWEGNVGSKAECKNKCIQESACMAISFREKDARCHIHSSGALSGADMNDEAEGWVIQIKPSYFVGERQKDNTHCYGDDGSNRVSIGNFDTLDQCASAAAANPLCGQAFEYCMAGTSCAKWCSCGKIFTSNHDCRENVNGNQAAQVFKIDRPLAQRGFMVTAPAVKGIGGRYVFDPTLDFGEAMAWSKHDGSGAVLLWEMDRRWIIFNDLEGVSGDEPYFETTDGTEHGWMEEWMDGWMNTDTVQVVEAEAFSCDQCMETGYDEDECECGVCGSSGDCRGSCNARDARPACI